MTTSLQAVQEKYVAEAKKRLRSDGSKQFQDVENSDSARIRNLAKDIWADNVALDDQLQQSPALKDGDSIKFLVVGAGISGIVSAVRLILAGFNASQIRLVETAGGVGGTWYWNRYPGLHCDVEAYVYMPLLEEMGYMPSHKYATGVEIRKYLNQVVQRYNLEDKILFRTKVTHLQWDESENCWTANLATLKGTGTSQEMAKSAVRAEFAILTAGYLSQPQIPKLESGKSLDVFAGDLFHTARWDYDVTGGSDQEAFPALDKLRGKRVGVIGTGATAIQVVPCLAKYAGELFVFQRTPSAVFSRGQCVTDPTEWKTKIANSPGWHKKRRENLAAIMSRSTTLEMPDLVNDEWTKQAAYSALTGEPKWANTSPEKIPELIGFFLQLDTQNMDKLRARVEDKVHDRATAEKLKPWFPVWCKRPTFSDTYLEAFNNPHVHLVDTEGRGIDGANPGGLTVQGTDYDLDVLVLATGYLVSTESSVSTASRAGVTVVGCGGQVLDDKYEANGPTTLHGVASGGFPNMFWTGAMQAGAHANIAYLYDAQAQHIAYIIAAAHERAMGGRVTVEVEADAEESWCMRIMHGATRFAVLSLCTPGYLNGEGQALKERLGMAEPSSQERMMKSARAATWPAGLPSYLEEIEKFRKDGQLLGFRVETV